MWISSYLEKESKCRERVTQESLKVNNSRFSARHRIERVPPAVSALRKFVCTHHSPDFPQTNSAASIKCGLFLTCLSNDICYLRRNGKWYSNTFSGHCYFKSTDGHESSWSFSQSRMNLDFARTAATSGGAIIVDSTRQGKKFPDSLSATVRLL